MTTPEEKKRRANLNKGIMDCKRAAYEGVCTMYLVKVNKTTYKVSPCLPPKRGT